jgi:molybdate transport system permease protein
VDWSPFWLSIKVAGWATFFSVTAGLLIAYPLARARFAGRDIAEGLVNLPLVLPPTVLGYALLVGLGRRSPINTAWEQLTGRPLGLVFTWHGAVVAACVASIPLFVSQARVAIAAIDQDIVDAARTDGAGRLPLLRRIILPMASPGLLAGTALAFARALGDFGATLMVAGDTPGLTRTMPLAIYDGVIMGEARTVQVFVVITCLLSLFVSLLAARLTPRR